MKGIDLKALKINSVADLYKLTVCFSALARAQIEAERWEYERNGLRAEAMQEFILDVRHYLSQNLEVRDRMIEFIEGFPEHRTLLE